MRNIMKLRFSLALLHVVVTALSIWLAKTSNDAREQEAGAKGVETNAGIVPLETTLDVRDARGVVDSARGTSTATAVIVNVSARTVTSSGVSKHVIVSSVGVHDRCSQRCC
jgi:hypothetical protein